MLLGEECRSPPPSGRPFPATTQVHSVIEVVWFFFRCQKTLFLFRGPELIFLLLFFAFSHKLVSSSSLPSRNVPSDSGAFFFFLMFFPISEEHSSLLPGPPTTRYYGSSRSVPAHEWWFSFVYRQATRRKAFCRVPKTAFTAPPQAF